MMEKKERALVLGAGSRKSVGIFTGGMPQVQQLGPDFTDCFKEVCTIDMEARHNPTVVWDLTKYPWPVGSDEFDEVHAYELLEHLTYHGDFVAFFQLWREIWRVTKPGGFVCGTTPWWESIWAFGDPGHRMVYNDKLFWYLGQANYAEVGKTTMTDYRTWWPAPYSFKLELFQMTGGDPLAEPPVPPEPKTAGFTFVLRKEVYDKS